MHGIVNTRFVWRCKASQLMAAGRPLVVPGFSTLEEMKTEVLKAAVLRTAKLTERWASGPVHSTSKPEARSRSFNFIGERLSHETKKQDNLKPLRSLHAEKIRLDITVSHCLCYIVKFKHFLLPPTRDGKLIGLNVETERHVGDFDMTRSRTRQSAATNNANQTRNRSSGLIFSGRVHYTSRSLYYIVSAGFVSG